jgi:hypothetical protein
MTIWEGIKLQGTHIEIPDCERDDLPQFFKDMGYKTGAEIGVLRGEFTEKFCQAGLKMYAIDPWAKYRNYRRHPREEPYDIMFEAVKSRLAPYDCTIVRKKSMDALEDFADESLDFIYIDGNHTIRYVIEDIYEWNRKVKKGGVISGHDYGTNARSPYSFQALHVKHAVDMMTYILGIKNWYILGNKYVVKGQKRYKWRSWLWVKE